MAKQVEVQFENALINSQHDVHVNVKLQSKNIKPMLRLSCLTEI